MVTFEHSLTIARPVAEVFAYLADVRNLPQWQADVVETRPDGEPSLGATFVEVRSFLGKRVESVMRIVEYEPDRVFSVEVAKGPIPFRVRHLLEPAGEGTRIRIEAAGDPGGVLRLAESLVVRRAEKTARKDFAELKRVLESQR